MIRRSLRAISRSQGKKKGLHQQAQIEDYEAMFQYVQKQVFTIAKPSFLYCTDHQSNNSRWCLNETGGYNESIKARHRAKDLSRIESKSHNQDDISTYL